MKENNEEAAIACLVCLFVLPFVAFVLFGTTYLVIYAASGFGYDLSFWPTFATVCLVFIFIRWIKG